MLDCRGCGVARRPTGDHMPAVSFDESNRGFNRASPFKDVRDDNKRADMAAACRLAVTLGLRTHSRFQSRGWKKVWDERNLMTSDQGCTSPIKEAGTRWISNPLPEQGSGFDMPRGNHLPKATSEDKLGHGMRN